MNKTIYHQGLFNVFATKLVIFPIALCLCQTFCFAENGEARWWQRENLQPSSNQIINPSYVQKKRTLEQAWDSHKKNLQAEARFRSMGQNTGALRLAAKESNRVMNQLTHELETIRPYITNRRTNDSGAVQSPVRLSVILNPQSSSSANSSHLPSSRVPPSQWHDRVLDELLNLLPEDSPKATTRMRYVLMLIPDDFDYRQDKIIVEGVKRVLRFETEKLFKGIPVPNKRPVNLVIGNGSVVCSNVYKNSAGWYTLYLKVQGTKIVFDDGSSHEPSAYYEFNDSDYNGGLYWAVGRVYPNTENVTKHIQSNKRRNWRAISIQNAQKDYERYKQNYAKSLESFVEKKSDVLKAGQFLDQLSELSGDSKWVADKSRIYNDMLRVLENNGHLKK